MNDDFKIDTGKSPPCLTAGDSATLALRASQTALQRHHFDPFPQPESVRVVAKFLNQLPVSMRVQIADRISASIGHPANDFRKIDPESVARWVVDGYPAERYPGVILGAPGLSVTFLSAITGFPYLPQPLLFNARRDMALDDAQGYLDAGRELAEPLLEKHKSFEAIIHYDPVHDRFLIRRVVFVRLKFLDLPQAYRSFIEKRLVPGSPVILTDCRYSWPRAKISDRLYFQLGGLGGIAPEDYIDEIETLKKYRERWNAPVDASWKIDKSYSEGPESEWGSSGEFLNQAEKFASGIDHKVIRIVHNHPSEMSKKIFNLFRHCWQGDDHPTDVYTGVFTHTEPRFPMITGCLPLWLPFITDENIQIANDILTDWREEFPRKKPEGTAYITLHPSFCSPPDIVQLSSWLDLFSRYFERVVFPGITPGRYPFDLGSYVSMYPEIVAIAKREKYPGTPFRCPTTSTLEEVLLKI